MTWNFKKHKVILSKDRKELRMKPSNNRLKGKIVERFRTQQAFANHIGVSSVTVTNKLNGRSQFTHDEIASWCTELGISRDDVGYYFFADKL